MRSIRGNKPEIASDEVDESSLLVFTAETAKQRKLSIKSEIRSDQRRYLHVHRCGKVEVPDLAEASNSRFEVIELLGFGSH